MRRLIDIVKDIATNKGNKEKINECFEELIYYRDMEEYVFLRNNNKRSKLDPDLWEKIQVNKICFKHYQLKYILESNEKKYCNVLYRQDLTRDDIADIIIETILNIKDTFNFNKGEGALVNYLKLKVKYRCIDEFNKRNEVFVKNNFTNFSYDDITEEFDDNFSENSNAECEGHSQRGMCNWDTYCFNNEEIEGYTIHKTRQQEVNELIKSYEYLTNNQKEKIKKLINAMDNGYTIVDCNCSSEYVTEGDIKVWRWKDDYFSLRYREIKEILFPNREDNCNKDIIQFLNSVNNKLNKYLIKKGYEDFVDEEYKKEVV